MKKILPLLIPIILLGCSVNKYYTVYVEHLDSRAEGDKFIDSLKSSGLDTIIGYYDGCFGCIQGRDKPYYIFWDSGKMWHLTKITRYSRFNEILGKTPPIKYISDNIETIEKEQLIKPQYEMSHFPYDYVRIILKDKEIKYQIKDYEKWANESAQKVILIDKIRSKLLQIDPGEWTGKNYKSETRRKDSW